MYVIDFRPEFDLIDIRWSGVFTLDGVARYSRDFRAGFLRHSFGPGYLLRLDMTESPVQPREVLDAFMAHMYSVPKSRRIAVVTPAVIQKMQVRRLMTQPYLEVFETAGPALEWLLERPDAVRAVA